MSWFVRLRKGKEKAKTLAVAKRLQKRPKGPPEAALGRFFWDRMKILRG
jgi:lipopolysaccharide biosynthesis protein